jgi:hypothetical protein
MREHNNESKGYKPSPGRTTNDPYINRVLFAFRSPMLRLQANNTRRRGNQHAINPLTRSILITLTLHSK